MIEGKPLPPTDKQCQGVGHFTRFTASLNASQLAEGDAALLTLALEGDYPDSVQTPVLNLPSELRSYESTSKMSTLHGTTVQTWEYVVQGLKPGTFTIPAQSIRFFDTNSRQYKTLKTEPLTITYTPSTRAKVVAGPLEPEKKEIEKERPQERSPVELPWMVFLLLFLIPPCVQAGSWIVKYYTLRTPRFIQRVRRALILRQTRRTIKKSERLHDPSGLYDTLKRAMIEYCDLPPESSEEAIAQALQQQGYDDKTWQALVHEVVHYTEYTQGGQRPVRPHIYKDITVWLKQLAQKKAVLLLSLMVMQTLSAHPSIDQIVYYTSTIPFIVWQVFVLISWWAVWFSPTRKLGLSFVCILLFCWWSLHAYRHYYPRLVVISDPGILYVGPDTSYPMRGKLPHQSVVVLAKKAGTWYYVSSPEGSGWIDSAQVALKREV